MELDEAIELIRPAVDAEGGMWADFGAGRGTFTRALAVLVGPEARIFAVDRDPRVLQIQRRWMNIDGGSGATVEPVHGDFRHLDSVRELAGIRLHGALFANSLHFVPDADLVLIRIARLLQPGGRMVVVEYDGRSPSRWVPHPISIERLRILAGHARLTPPSIVNERPSAFGGIMYCAVLLHPDRGSE